MSGNRFHLRDKPFFWKLSKQNLNLVLRRRSRINDHCTIVHWTSNQNNKNSFVHLHTLNNYTLLTQSSLCDSSHRNTPNISALRVLVFFAYLYNMGNSIFPYKYNGSLCSYPWTAQKSCRLFCSLVLWSRGALYRAQSAWWIVTCGLILMSGLAE